MALIGETRWFVEWCSEQGMVDPAHPEWGADPDKDKRHTKGFKTRAEAEAFARHIYPEDKCGFVRYWPAEFTAYDAADAAAYPHVGYWEETADPEYYEGE